MVTIYEDKGDVFEDQSGEALNEEAVKPVVIRRPQRKEALVEEPDKRSEAKPFDGLSPFMRNFLAAYEANLRQKHGTVEPTIKVSELLGKLARVYERVRNVVEYKGEHVLRRNAIERILRRLVWEQETAIAPKALRTGDVNTRHISEALLKELIRARYLPNNTIPTSKINEVERVVEKYMYLLKHLHNLPSDISIVKARDWLWGVASSEIEDLVDPSNRELYVALMYDWFISYFDWQDLNISEDQKRLQVYLAIHRSYPKSDEQIMRFHLLQKKVPDWQQADDGKLEEFIKNFPTIFQGIEDDLNFGGRYTLYRKIQRHSAAFDIFHTIAREEKDGLRNLLLDEKRFEEKIKNVCGEKYKQIRVRVNTGIVRSIVYIFITKVLLALILEVPYEIYRLGDVRYIPLALNIMFPPIMMWGIGFSIKIPGEKNTQEIIARIKSVIYESKAETRHTFSIVEGGGKSTLAKIFTVIYTLLFVLVFGGVTYLLWKIHFTLLGILIFFGFMSLVLLFAFRVRFSAEQLKVEAEEEGLFEHLFSYLSIPFLNFGFYLSKGLAKLNFLTILLDFLIEAPLKSVIEIFEEWTSFLRKKKEEVVEIPE